MRLLSFCVSLAAIALPALAQQCPATVEEPAKLRVGRKGTTEQRLKVSLPTGCHANSNAPTEAFLIPLKLTWGPGAPGAMAAVEAVETVYPKPALEKYAFNEKPISVVSGQFEIVTKFSRVGTAQPGPSSITGKLRYQACNDKMCFPPKTVEVRLPLLLE
jgi:hypothetical protein